METQESELFKFKNIHKGEKALLFAPGPSLNEFEDTFGDEYKRCAVNGVIIHPEFRDKLDYYVWAGDIDIPKHPQPQYHYTLNSLKYLKKTTVKFANCWVNNGLIHPAFGVQTQISPEQADELGFIKYNLTYDKNKKYNWSTRLEDKNIGLDDKSVAFHAMQILLYMGFEEIILVGFDCGGEHSFKKYDECKEDVCDWGNQINRKLIKRWISFKRWCDEKYPSCKIKCVNPVGLKNIIPIFK
tara:strand:- start:2133 stop:2858 length:726 start_codon:yes stop_codon:yes gene_type:complete